MSLTIDDIGDYKEELTPEEFEDFYHLNKETIDITPTLKLNSRYVITRTLPNGSIAHYRICRERGKIIIKRSAADEVNKLTLLRMIQHLTQRVSELEHLMQNKLCQLRPENCQEDTDD